MYTEYSWIKFNDMSLDVKKNTCASNNIGKEVGHGGRKQLSS